MKELKYNYNCLRKRKEFYFAVFGILLINLAHLIISLHFNIVPGSFIENSYTAEYQFILYNTRVTLQMIVIIVFPLLCNIILSDMSWIEKKRKIDNIMFSRLNLKKLVFTRYLLIVACTTLVLFIGFMLNYLSFYIIYGSGNAITYFQSPAFMLLTVEEFFLDGIRVSNPILFTIIITSVVSLLIGLITGLSYLLSFFAKQRIFIYIMPFLLLMGMEYVFSIFNLNNFTYVKLLQPFSMFSMNNVIITFGGTLFISIVLLLFNTKKRDILQ